MVVNLRVLIASYESLRSDFGPEDEKSSVVCYRRPPLKINVRSWIKRTRGRIRRKRFMRTNIARNGRE